ncbi:AAA family ATPase [Halobacillus fulvus]|nr:AAA family ATPase [Halobacillus fulvus]
MHPEVKLARQSTINIVLNEEKNKSVIGREKRVESHSAAPFQRIDQYFSKVIGLEDLKKQIKEIYAQVLVSEKRQELGLKSNLQVLHMIFKGNPGTGKTTIARMVSELFKEVGVLEKGHFTEVDRSDLVGEYIGHTAKKTKDVIRKALGGVLFIDEAYSLARGGEKDFGKEAIDTIVKCMEDHHDELIIILAGYPEEMDHFLTINPGLASRFPIQLDFSNYEAVELLKIAKVMLEDREYCMTKETERRLYLHLYRMSMRPGANFSNARYVRNLLEEAIRKHAWRIICGSNLKKAALMTLEPDDFSECLHQDNS